MSEAIALAAKLLLKHEAFRAKPYRCTAGKLTIAIGRNLEDRGISRAEADMLLNNDIADCIEDLQNYNFWHFCNDARKAALIDFRFQLGYGGFRAFKKTIHHLELLNFEVAANEMLDSKWAKQVPGRAAEITTIIRSGELDSRLRGNDEIESVNHA